jgi:hypothetical protein
MLQGRGRVEEASRAWSGSRRRRRFSSRPGTASQADRMAFATADGTDAKRGARKP